MQSTVIPEYDEKLVIHPVERITVIEDKLLIEFKSVRNILYKVRIDWNI